MPVYLAALAFGLVLIGASAFAGDAHDGHDGDVHAGDHGGPGDHGEYGGHASEGASSAFLSNVLSLRFWTWALGAFGMAGTALHLLGLPAAVHVPVALVLGAGVGSGAAWIFRKLRVGSATTPASEESLLGNEAEVVLPLHPGKLGKVRLRVADQDVELLASAGPEEKVEMKGRVVVVRFRDGVAEVRPAPWKE